MYDGILIDLYLQELFEFDNDTFIKYQMLDQDFNEIFAPDGMDND